MAIELITAKPWEKNDPERIAKFRKGTPGVDSDRWTEKPNVAACWFGWRGDYRDWRIEGGKSYQSQLYCRFWETFINPSGFSCAVCEANEILNWLSPNVRDALEALIAAKGKEAAGDLLVWAVQAKRLDQKTALELADALNLS